MGQRAEMRREKHKKDPVYVLSASQIQQIKDESADQAMQTAFFLMLGLPTMVIHDKFGLLMKREKREETFTDLVLDQYDSFRRGYFNLDDVKKVLKEEAGIEDVREKYNRR